MNPYDIGPILRRITGAVPGASDILFSPNHAPLLVRDGKTGPLPLKDFKRLTPYQTEILALSLLRERPAQMALFAETGSVSFSLTLRRVGHFRVNVFKQRDMVALALRIIPLDPPTLASLGLPHSLFTVSELRQGLVVFAGPAGSGKSTTLAAAVQQVTRAYAHHIVTIENPIEFVFSPERGMIHQREIGCDALDFPGAIESARQLAPQALVVSEMRDEATAAAVLAAVESGLLVLAGVSAEDTFAALQALIRLSPPGRDESHRQRLAETVKWVVSQQLLPRSNGRGRIAAVEILKTNPAVRDIIGRGAPSRKELADLLRAGEAQGMQLMETDVQRLVAEGLVAAAPTVAMPASAKSLAPESRPANESEQDLAPALGVNLAT